MNRYRVWHHLGHGPTLACLMLAIEADTYAEAIAQAEALWMYHKDARFCRVEWRREDQG